MMTITLNRRAFLLTIILLAVLIVVDAKTLHIYPDVYGRRTNSVKKLRAELEAEGVDTSGVGDGTLRKMIAQASKSKEFVVSVADIEKGQALTAGKVQPLPGHSAKS